MLSFSSVDPCFALLSPSKSLRLKCRFRLQIYNFARSLSTCVGGPWSLTLREEHRKQGVRE